MKTIIISALLLLTATTVKAQENSKAFNHLEQVIGLLGSIDNFRNNMGKLISNENGIRLYEYNNEAVKCEYISDHFVGKDQHGGLYIEYIRSVYTPEFVNAITKEYPKNEPGADFVKKDGANNKSVVYTLTYEGSPILDIIDYKDPLEKDALNIFLSGL